MGLYERLSFLDASFLALESKSTHMHVAALAVFEAEPLRDADGGIDIERIRRYISGRLHLVPRYRQLLAHVPVERAPVWIDDEHFSIGYHVRHTSLPRPGSDRQLKDLVGRLLSQQLDRRKPMWEIWVVEGLAGDRAALISKIHHSMVDGMAGVDLMAVLLGFSPSDDVPDPEPFIPKPPPTGAQLIVGETARRVRRAIDAMRSFREAREQSRVVTDSMRTRVQAAGKALASGWLTPASRTPITQEIGPNRRFDTLEIDLDRVKAVKDATGVTVNDVILATVAGAVRRFFADVRSFDVTNVDFRVMAPVSVANTDRPRTTGNQVAMWLLPLPIAIDDPLQRLAAIKQETARLKVTNQALGASTLVQLSSGAPITLVALASRLATAVRPFSMTVTNVPGPQFPLYLLGSRMLATFPVVPLYHNQGLGIALFSYDGAVYWGFNADWDLVEDLDEFVAQVEASFRELEIASGAVQAKSTSRKSAGRAKTRRKSPAS